MNHITGDFEIFPISAVEEMAIGLPAWRWMATLTIRVPGEEFPRFWCRRTMCPIRLVHWVYLMALRQYRESTEIAR